jgi:heme oxygenase
MPLTIFESVSQRLKKGTAEAHQQTETILAPRLASIRTIDDYACILKMFYGYFSPLEKAISHYITTAVLPDVHERRNSLFILRDLEAIGCSTEKLLTCQDIPKIISIPRALGAMYVLEGSTLGGRMISKMMMKNTSVVFDESYLNFFNGYKEDTGNKWKAFLSVIERYEAEGNELIDSANETFDGLTKWMEQSL